MLRKTAHWQKPCQSLGKTRNLWIHPLQGRVSNRVGVFFDRAPPHCTGLGGAEVRSRTIPILPTGKRANTTEVCSPQTSADQARAPGTTNRKSPPCSGKPNRRSLKTVTNTPRAQLKQTRTTFTDGYPYSTCPAPRWRPPSLLYGQLGGSLQRPMGFGSGKVIQDRVYLRTKTKRTTWPNCHECRTVPGHDSRNSRAPQERSGGAGGFSQRGVCKPSVPGAQVRWRMETSTKPQEPQSVCGSTPLQSIRTLKGVLQKDNWLLKLDLKDAYLSIPIHQNHQHFLRFPWKGQLWQFKALPFGLSSAPWVFTKVTKPISSILRKLGIRLILYLDDMLIMSRTQAEAAANLSTVMTLLIGLGFIINLKKSVLTPTQQLEFLGFTVNSQKMTISLPSDKLYTLKKLSEKIKNRGRTTVQELSRLLGMMVAAHPAILPAPLYYRHLEATKIRTLQMEGSYSSEIPELTPRMVEELTWWTSRVSGFNG